MYLYLFNFFYWCGGRVGKGAGGPMAVTGTCVQMWQSGLRVLNDSGFATEKREKIEEKKIIKLPTDQL